MLNYEKLKISFDSVISKEIHNRINDMLPGKRVLFHIPSKRLESTFIVMFSLQPLRMVLLLTPEVRDEFLFEFKKFKNWFRRNYNNYKLPETVFYNIESPESSIFEKLNSGYYYDFLLKVINRNTGFSRGYERVILDITGGTKLHSIILYDFALKKKLPFSYLYTREINKKDGIFAIPGEEKLFIKLPDSEKINTFSIDKFVDINLRLKDNSFIIDFRLNNRLYEKRVPVNLGEIEKLKYDFRKIYNEVSDYIIFKSKEEILKKIKSISRRFFDKYFPEKFLELVKNYKYFKFYFDSDSYFLPVDFFLYYEKGKLCIRDFIFDFSFFSVKDEYVFSNKGNKSILILVNYRDRFEREFFLKEAEEIKLLAERRGIKSFTKINSGKKEIISYFKNRWEIVHFIGHTGFDSNGSYFEIKKDRLYANEISMKIADMFFSNSCNSSPIIDIRVNKSLPYNFLRYGGRTFIGTFWEINSEEAYKFSVNFYKKLFEGNSAGSSFFSTIKEYSKYDFIPANYHIYGDALYTI